MAGALIHATRRANSVVHTANIYHPAIVKLQPKADKVEEKIYNLMIKGI